MSEQKQETPRPLMLRQISAETYTTYLGDIPYVPESTVKDLLAAARTALGWIATESEAWLCHEKAQSIAAQLESAITKAARDESEGQG